jgi:hypothetical protein
MVSRNGRKPRVFSGVGEEGIFLKKLRVVADFSGRQGTGGLVIKGSRPRYPKLCPIALSVAIRREWI